MAHYDSLPTAHLLRPVHFQHPQQELPPHVQTDSPALDVLTDLRKVAAVTIDPGASIASANDRMIAAGIRLLFVVDAENIVQGLITATDILGERPIVHMQQTRTQTHELIVSDIMTPYTDLEVLHMSDVVRARVGNIVATLRQAGRQHALVVDTDPRTGTESVRGIFSATQIGKQLGTAIETQNGARSFAELEQVIVTS